MIKNELLTIVKRINEILGTDDYVLVADHGLLENKTHWRDYMTPTLWIIIPDKGAATRQKIINALKNKLENPPEEITEETFKKYNFIFFYQKKMSISAHLECY